MMMIIISITHTALELARNSLPMECRHTNTHQYNILGLAIDLANANTLIHDRIQFNCDKTQNRSSTQHFTRFLLIREGNQSKCVQLDWVFQLHFTLRFQNHFYRIGSK